MKRFTLTLLALAATFSLPARAQDVPGEGDVDKAEVQREAQNTLRVLNRIGDSLPREPLEPKQLLERVHPEGGSAVERETEWVAKSVGWLPYRGALRGPRGVLIERRGNAWASPGDPFFSAVIGLLSCSGYTGRVYGFLRTARRTLVLP